MIAFVGRTARSAWSFLRSHLAWAVAAAMALLATVFGLVAFTQPSAAVASGSPASTTPAPTAPDGSPGTSPGAGGLRHTAHGVRGHVTAVGQSGFTLQEVDGASIQVVLTPTTRYGTPKHPTTQSDIQVGSRAGVRGAISGASITARLVVVLPAAGSPGTPATPAPPATPATPPATPSAGTQGAVA